MSEELYVICPNCDGIGYSEFLFADSLEYEEHECEVCSGEGHTYSVVI